MMLICRNVLLRDGAGAGDVAHAEIRRKLATLMQYLDGTTSIQVPALPTGTDSEATADTSFDEEEFGTWEQAVCDCLAVIEANLLTICTRVDHRWHPFHSSIPEFLESLVQSYGSTTGIINQSPVQQQPTAERTAHFGFRMCVDKLSLDREILASIEQSLYCVRFFSAPNTAKSAATDDDGQDDDDDDDDEADADNRPIHMSSATSPTLQRSAAMVDHSSIAESATAVGSSVGLSTSSSTSGLPESTASRIISLVLQLCQLAPLASSPQASRDDGEPSDAANTKSSGNQHPLSVVAVHITEQLMRHCADHSGPQLCYLIELASQLQDVFVAAIASQRASLPLIGRLLREVLVHLIPFLQHTDVYTFVQQRHDALLRSCDIGAQAAPAASTNSSDTTKPAATLEQKQHLDLRYEIARLASYLLCESSLSRLSSTTTSNNNSNNKDSSPATTTASAERTTSDSTLTTGNGTDAVPPNVPAMADKETAEKCHMLLSSPLFAAGMESDIDSTTKRQHQFLLALIQRLDPSSEGAVLAEFMASNVSSKLPAGKHGGPLGTPQTQAHTDTSAPRQIDSPIDSPRLVDDWVIPIVDKAERAVAAALLKHAGLVPETMTFAGYIRKSPSGGASLQPPETLRQVWSAANRIRQWMIQQRQQLDDELADVHTAGVIEKAMFLLTIAAAPVSNEDTEALPDSATSSGAAGASKPGSIRNSNDSSSGSTSSAGAGGVMSLSRSSQNMPTLRDSLPSIPVGDNNNNNNNASARFSGLHGVEQPPSTLPVDGTSSTPSTGGDATWTTELLRSSLPSRTVARESQHASNAADASYLSWKNVRDWLQGGSSASTTPAASMARVTSFIQKLPVDIVTVLPRLLESKAKEATERLQVLQQFHSMFQRMQHTPIAGTLVSHWIVLMNSFSPDRPHYLASIEASPVALQTSLRVLFHSIISLFVSLLKSTDNTQLRIALLCAICVYYRREDHDELQVLCQALSSYSRHTLVMLIRVCLLLYSVSMSCRCCDDT